jgi:predicted esterase
VRRLTDAGTAVTAIAFEGGHEWGGDVIAAVARFLETSGKNRR